MPVMLVQWQPVLGQGCSHSKEEPTAVELNAQKLNLMGHPEETRFLAFCALKEVYQDDFEMLPTAMRLIGEDMKVALEQGIPLKAADPDGPRLRLAAVHIKGDWPWLIEAGRLTRHFRHAPKKERSNCQQTGVCHLCMAGTLNFPFTDCGPTPRFVATMGSAAAATWCDEWSPLTELLPKMPDAPEHLYRGDIWRNWHLGAGRYFLSSAMVIMVPQFEGSSVPDKFWSLTAAWREYFTLRQVKPILMKITKQTLNADGPLEWPEGGWQKADTTRLLAAVGLGSLV